MRLSYYLVFACIALAAVIIGFFRTFFIPVSTGSFQAPPIVHIHGAFAFAWVLLFLFQTSTIYKRKFKWHRKAGKYGVPIALGVAGTLPFVGMFEVEKSLRNGIGDFSYSTIVGVCTGAILFLGFVAAGIIYRKRPAWHKRFLLLATLYVIWPAWFRFRHYFPEVPRPDIWFGLVLSNSMILIAWILDYRTHKRIHPVLLYGGLFLIVEGTVEVYLFGAPWWQALGKMLYEGLRC